MIQSFFQCDRGHPTNSPVEFGDICLQEQDLIRPVCDLAKSERQARIDPVADVLDNLPHSMRLAGAQYDNTQAGIVANSSINRFSSIVNVQVVASLLTKSKRRAFRG
jgi:hypothetical protein